MLGMMSDDVCAKEGMVAPIGSSEVAGKFAKALRDKKHTHQHPISGRVFVCQVYPGKACDVRCQAVSVEMKEGPRVKSVACAWASASLLSICQFC